MTQDEIDTQKWLAVYGAAYAALYLKAVAAERPVYDGFYLRQIADEAKEIADSQGPRPV